MQRIGSGLMVGALGSLLLAPAKSASSAALDLVQTLENGTGGLAGLGGARGLALSPDGKNVYVASQTDDSVVNFSRNAAGGLVFAETQKDGTNGIDGLGGASAVTVSPDGAHVYVAGTAEDAIAIFSRSATTGALAFVGFVRDGTAGVDALAGVRSVAVSPDGAHVYAAAFDDRAVMVFARDPISGALSAIEKQVDGVNGVDGLSGASATVVSPDGANVYAAGANDDAVVVFGRDPATGKLTFVEEKRNGANGITGLSGASALALSADGAHLYVAGPNGDTLAVFARSPVTGALTFIEKQQNGAQGVDGLDVPLAVAVSPEGGYVYAAASNGRSVLVFIRNAATGALTFLERQEDGVGGVAGLAGADGVAPSPDGGQLYTTAGASDAVDVFDVTLGITTTTGSTTTTTTTRPRRTTTTSTTLPPCGSTPRTDCREPVLHGRAFLAIRRGLFTRGDSLRWRWTGAATFVADFGSPRRETGYRLCIYQPLGDGARLIVDATAPADGHCDRGHCWVATPRGFLYRSRQSRPDGVRRIVLRAGVAENAALTVVGKGARLALPTLPLIPKVTAQIRASNGMCWSAEYSAPLINSETRFKARAD
jgi:6-phosphogluconolactonase (cycloisomerase 2 family)